MSYSLKNKTTVLFATVFSFLVVFANNVKAEEEQVADIAPQVSAESAVEEQDVSAENETEKQDAFAQQSDDVIADDPFGLDDPLAEDENERNERLPDMRERGNIQADSFVAEQQGESNVSPDAMPEVSLDDFGDDLASDAGLAEVAIDASPKSPFEKFGNAILSRVDNELFNQMSEIEKQTTLLNLELKREEVKNRIDALKAQRERAKQEELNMQAEREKKARDEELARQKELLFEQMKLKEKEKEVEKIRQAKVLNSYMNEVLVSNQQWVEMNGKLKEQIRILQEERKKLIDEFGKKLEDVNGRVAMVLQNTEATRAAFERKIASYNKQIEGLRQVIVEKENALQTATTVAETNPFASGDNIEEDAIDMSKEYAIMDITGKGDNIVAKLVSQDGTTFMVRKGSVLKGGETVVKITDKVITFENNGVKSYLYTSGMVMQYEPTEAFNEATKTPHVATGVVNNQVIRNVRGAGGSNNNNATPAADANAASGTNAQPAQGANAGQQTAPAQSSAPRTNKGVASFSQGMMVK